MVQFFKPIGLNGYEPAVGLIGATNGSMKSIGHLFVASLVHNGPGPGFLASWVYEYLVGGIEKVLLPTILEDPLYAEVGEINCI